VIGSALGRRHAARHAVDVKREPIPEFPDLPARRSASLQASDAAELARIRAMTMIERMALALEFGSTRRRR
jgi:hypothetical protein